MQRLAQQQGYYKVCLLLRSFIEFEVTRRGGGRNGRHGVMMAWNEFDLCNTLEITREHGEVCLEITRAAAKTTAAAT